MQSDIEVDTERLYNTTDAAVWAEEFAKVFPNIDEGTMIGWFANAFGAAEMARRSPDRRVVYQSTPDVYEYDLRLIVRLIEGLCGTVERCEDVFFDCASLDVWSKNGYPIGNLHLDDDQWVFTPHNESDVPA